MIFRKKPSSELPAEPEPPVSGKGRPTPKRREAEAKNRRPLVVDDRKAAKEAARRQRNEAYARQREGMLTGDERYMPARDKGPVRRFARDYVDARWNIGELFMPVAFLMIIAMVIVTLLPAVATYVTLGMYVIVFGGIIDGLLMVFILRRHLKARFDADQIPRFTGMYAFSRAFMIRPWRMPKPQNRRGEFPGHHK